MPEPTFLQRLKERKLVQWAVAYSAGAFVVFQAVEVMAEPWGISPALQRAVHVVLVFGLFITLVLAWYHGEKGRQRVSGPELLMVAVLLVIAGGVLSVLPKGDEGAETGEIPVALEGDDRPGIAVFPCENWGPDPEDAYFASGIHDEILLRLSKISGLRSIGRQSMEWYSEHSLPTRQVAQELGVGYLGECSVLKDAERNQVRLTFQLIDGSTGAQIWAENYDEDLTARSIFDIHSDLAQRVAREVGAVLTPEERAQIEARSTDNQEAYDRYVTALGLAEAGWDTSDPDARQYLQESMRLFQEAVSLDPTFSSAYAQLAITAAGYWFLGWDESDNSVEVARDAAAQALRLNPEAGDTYLALGNVRYYLDRDYNGGREAFEEARRRLPGDPEPLQSIGLVIRRQGHFEESARIHEGLFLLDPRNADLANELSFTYGALRRNHEASQWAERAIQLGFGREAYETAALAHLRKGDIDAARAVLSQVPDSTDGYAIRPGFWTEAYARDYEAAALWLAKATGPSLQRTQQDWIPVAEYQGFLHRWNGRSDLALDAFRAAESELRARGQTGLHLAITHAALGNRSAALAQIDSIVAAWQRTPDHLARPIPFPEMAIVHVLLEDHETAIGVLEDLMDLGYEEAVTVADLRLSPLWDPLRDHPRFHALVGEDRDEEEG